MNTIIHKRPIMGMLAVMLVASFLLAGAAFVAPKTISAQMCQSETQYSTNSFETGGCCWNLMDEVIRDTFSRERVPNCSWTGWSLYSRSHTCDGGLCGLF